MVMMRKKRKENDKRKWLMDRSKKTNTMMNLIVNDTMRLKREKKTVK